MEIYVADEDMSFDVYCKKAQQFARGLAKAIKDIMGAKKGKPDAAQKSKIYEKALKDLYNIQIEVPDGMTNTHFDKVFDMLGTLPKEHVKQDSFKKLRYKDQTNYGGVYYSDCTVEMGDFGKAKGEEGYEIDGQPLAANSFDVTTLHEVGHAVDAQHSIMISHGKDTGLGKWEQETADKVAQAQLAELKSTITLKNPVTDTDLTTAIADALDTGVPAQPDTIGDDDWKAILKFLTANCVPIRDAAQPYFNEPTSVIGDRIYTEASKGDWWSYSSSERGKTKVNLYQWRSPFEWFAEVYAISWLKKKKPPAGVGAEAAKYMWQG